jgi:glycerol kinase
MARERTGLDVDPTFTAAKLSWIFRNRPEIADGLRAGRHFWGTVDCWLIWKLTGGALYATEAGNASRTMLFDIRRLSWASELFDLFSIAPAARPEVRRSDGPFGSQITPYSMDRSRLPARLETSRPPSSAMAVMPALRSRQRMGPAPSSG